MKAKTEFTSGWLFPDDIKAPILAEYVDTKDEPDKNGKPFPVVYFLGKSEQITGDLKISGYKLVFDKPIIDKFGDDTALWKPFLCEISVKKGKVFVSAK